MVKKKLKNSYRMDQKIQDRDVDIGNICIILFGICGIFSNALEIRLLFHKGKKYVMFRDDIVQSGMC